MAIKFKGTETSGQHPPSLGERELAWNLTDKSIYTANSIGTIIEFFGTDTDEKVKVSGTDTTAGYLEDKVIAGDGIILSTAGANQEMTATAEVYLARLNNQLLAVFNDTDRGKTLSVESYVGYFAEARLNNNEWMAIGTATDNDTGFIMKHQGTIVSAVGHTSNSATTDIQVYIDGTNQGAVLSFTGNTEQSQINHTLDINFNAGSKIRVRNVGSTMQDTTVQITVKWRI